MSAKPKIGHLYEYSEAPYRFVVKLVAFWAEPCPQSSDMGCLQYWIFEAVRATSFGLKPLEQFRVMNREKGPSYCWYADELDAGAIERFYAKADHQPAELASAG